MQAKNSEVIIKQSEYSDHVSNTMLDGLGNVTNVIGMYGFSGTFIRVARGGGGAVSLICST